MPIYKSWADFFITSYAQILSGVIVPFTFGNFEDVPKIKLFETWLSATGYIKARRSPQ